MPILGPSRLQALVAARAEDRIQRLETTAGEPAKPLRILLIEDDPMIGKAMRQGLVQAGFALNWVTDRLAAQGALAQGVYDLAILDLGLPRQDGMALLAALRGAAQIVTLTWAPDGRAVYASDPRVRIPFSATEALTAVHADDEEWIVYPDVSASGVAQAALRSAALRGANGRLNQHPRSLRRCWPRPFWSAP